MLLVDYVGGKFTWKSPGDEWKDNEGITDGGCGMQVEDMNEKSIGQNNIGK